MTYWNETAELVLQTKTFADGLTTHQRRSVNINHLAEIYEV